MIQFPIQNNNIAEGINYPYIQKYIPKLKEFCFALWQEIESSVNNKDQTLSTICFDISMEKNKTIFFKGVEYPFSLYIRSNMFYDIKLYNSSKKKYEEKVRVLQTLDNQHFQNFLKNAKKGTTPKAYFDITLTKNTIGLVIKDTVISKKETWKDSKSLKIIQNYIPISYNPEIKESKLENLYSYGLDYKKEFHTQENINAINNYLKSLPDNYEIMISLSNQAYKKLTPHQLMDIKYTTPKQKNLNFTTWFNFVRKIKLIQKENQNDISDIDIFFYLKKYQNNVALVLKWISPYDDSTIEEPYYHFNIT